LFNSLREPQSHFNSPQKKEDGKSTIHPEKEEIVNRSSTTGGERETDHVLRTE
jgi:hypothetical protein